MEMLVGPRRFWNILKLQSKQEKVRILWAAFSGVYAPIYIMHRYYLFNQLSQILLFTFSAFMVKS